VGAHISEEFGGMGFDNNTVTVMLEELGKLGGSFDSTYAAHTGIGMLPIFYFGTEEQKTRFLPKMCTAELKTAYCLTEPGSGSDALAAKTTAILDESRSHYILNGQKMWITNAAFADIFIVFAQVDGDKFTAFIVDSRSEGIQLGEEENKLGIKASSTRQVFLENVKVPVGNLLGQTGRGHIIAFNVLNIGRYKLGNLCMGGMKKISSISVKYANQRHQFGVPISSFGAIKKKLADEAIYTFAIESAVYRVSNLMKDKKEELMNQGHSFEQALLEAAEEYAIECAIIKVFGSETLDMIVDESLQIHGGNGFSEEYEIARLYRDSRINKIYEGTNEINRLLMVKMLMKRVMKGKLNMVDAAWAVQKELTKLPSFGSDNSGLNAERLAIENFKKILLMTAGAAVKYQMDGKLDLVNNQQIIMMLADLLIWTFVAESVFMRLNKIHALNTDEQIKEKRAAMRVFLHDCQDQITKLSKDALASFASGDEQRIMLMGIQRFAKYPPQNVVHLRKMIADMAIERDSYAFD
jgi:alkylation response protein AidB-like acyl-CoA dehydrogenase